MSNVLRGVLPEKNNNGSLAARVGHSLRKGCGFSFQTIQSAPSISILPTFRQAVTDGQMELVNYHPVSVGVCVRVFCVCACVVLMVPSHCFCRCYSENN